MVGQKMCRIFSAATAWYIAGALAAVAAAPVILNGIQPDHRDFLVDAVGEELVSDSETYVDSLEDELAVALSRVEGYDTSSLCKMLSEKQVKLVSVQASGMMEMMLENEEWGSLADVIDAESERYFKEGCPAGLGTWMLARKNRMSQTTRALINDVVSAIEDR